MINNIFNEKNPYITKFHKGIYAVIQKEDKVLLIKKARGPYTGLYDLPGGSPESGESEEQTLIREIMEETTCSVLSYSNRREKTICFSSFTKESGEEGCLEHTGILFDVAVEGNPSQLGDGLDSNGAVWVDKKNLSIENATPFVLIGIGREMISLANKEGFVVDVCERKPKRLNNTHGIIAGVLLLNSKGNVILQRVAYTKKVDAGKWSYSAAGHVDAGESYPQAAIRELKEEMGIDAQLDSYVGSSCIMRDGKLRAFHHLFVAHSDDKIIPDASEVAEIKEFTISELKEKIKTNPDEFKDIFVKLFHMFCEKENL